PGQPVSGGPNDTSVGEISVKTGNNARNGGKNSLNRLIRCVCGKKIGPDPRNFNQRVSLGRNDLLIRTFLREQFIEFNELLLFEDLNLFNQRMAEYLVLYNSKRPHKSLELMTPVDYILRESKNCNMWWTHTT
ncbi:IS3 family transposase, partial [Kluyvera cryocrescens]